MSWPLGLSPQPQALHWVVLSGLGAPGRLGGRGIQGLSPDELSVETAFLQELFMCPRLRRKEGQRATQPNSEFRALAGLASY